MESFGQLNVCKVNPDQYEVCWSGLPTASQRNLKEHSFYLNESSLGDASEFVCTLPYARLEHSKFLLRSAKMVCQLLDDPDKKFPSFWVYLIHWWHYHEDIIIRYVLIRIKVCCPKMINFSPILAYCYPRFNKLSLKLAEDSP